MRYAIVRFTNCVDFENAEQWGLPSEGIIKKSDVCNAIKAKAQEVGATVGGFQWEIVEDPQGDYWLITFSEILSFDISLCPKTLPAWEIICRDETPLYKFVKFSDAGNDCSIKASNHSVGDVLDTIIWEEDQDDNE
jgi:hypothetical protein